MYKNQLQELAQRSCFNLPSYSCIREGPDHAPRFKASVNFNGEIFDSPSYCTTLRQAEHSAAEVALNVLSTRGPSRSLTARVLDETGSYKNLLQKTAHRAGLKLPVYTTVRSGPGHVPTFTCSVELAGMNFHGEVAKTKKQAEKNAAIAAWSALKRSLGSMSLISNKEGESSGGDQEQQEQAVVTRLLSNLRLSSKEEHSRQLRRRPDHQAQARRRSVRSAHNHRDNNNASTSTNSLVQDLQHWRLIDELLTDFIPRASEKPSSFASLLPPPPPRMESKILPPTATLNNKSDKSSYYNSGYNSRPTIIPVQMRGSTSRTQVVPSPLEEHQKDEDEWLGLKSNVLINKKPYAENEGHSNCGSNPSSPAFNRQFPMSPAAGASSSSLMGRRSIYNSQGLSAYSHRGVAPAVQIRSVIPVCAAPPVAPTTLPRIKETTTTSNGNNGTTDSQPETKYD